VGNMFSLRGKIAVITGGTSGIGLAAAKRFFEAGATVVIAGRRDASELAGRIGVTYRRTDVGDEAQVERLMDETAARFGRIDVCINNAGIFTDARPMADTTVETPVLTSSAVGEAEATISRTSSTLNDITRPEDVAALMHFLAADDCSTITGQAIVIDAGMSAGYSVGTCEAIVKASRMP
jgi:NAD(P)-dependent dehydrogenase (short-subunit alcohol dehydrogenase family)